jgi:hypothetical protein
MLKVVIALCLVLVATPAIADVTSELARCALEAEHLYPGPPNKGAQNGRSGQLTYRNALRTSKRACEQRATESLENVQRRSRRMKAA